MTKAEKEKPWGKWFWSDWRKDARLHRCSYAARGLWKDMLSLMGGECDRFGYLLMEGQALAASDLAGLFGGSEREVQKLLTELAGRNVYSRLGDPGMPDDLQAIIATDIADGVIFSRRMVRDKAKADRDRENGKGGGNPSLKGSAPKTAQPDNGGVNPPDKAKSQSPESEAKGNKKQEAVPAAEPPKPVIPAFELPPDIPAEPFADFVEMRVKVRKPMTDKAKAMLVTKLRGLAAEGENITAVLNQSVGNSWTTVYAVKTEGGRINANKPVNASFGSRIGRVIESRAERGFAFEDGGGDSGAPDSLEDQGSPGDGNPQLRLTAQA